MIDLGPNVTRQLADDEVVIDSEENTSYQTPIFVRRVAEWRQSR